MTRRKPQPAWQKLDPNFAAEEAKYGRAAPSRPFLYDFLAKHDAPMSWDAVCAELELDDEWLCEAVRRRLKAMVRDGEVILNRKNGYGVASRMDLVRGRVIGHPEGFGFLVPEDSSPDLFLSAREMRSLMHGDRIVARVSGVDHRGRREGGLVEVLERNTLRVVGRFVESKGVTFIEPDNRRIAHEILVPPDGRLEASNGQIVVAEIIQQPDKRQPPMGRVIEVLGDHMAPGMEVEIAIVKYEIPTEWPEAALEEAAAFGETVPEAAYEGREDLRDTPLVTIDGITARDFDDAVFCERRGRHWRVLVAIADVSWYVRPGSALDLEAQRRGNSVYFPDRVVPMLPEALSNGLCSLNPDVDRLCMVCEMTINDGGHIVRSRFFDAVMRSHARLTYDAVAAMLVDGEPSLCAQYAEILPHLHNLYGVFQVLTKARGMRGALDFDTAETVIEYGADRKIERIVPSSRNDAHRLIEECMIAANVAAATFLSNKRIPALYRVHPGPTQERLENLRIFLGELGLGLGGGDTPDALDYAATLERARERPDFHLIQTVMLRSLAQAVYSPENEGHFGLALEAYAHYTSPIRRYPDLQVHRALRHAVNGGKARGFDYTAGDLQRLGDQCSMTERRADEATRDAVEWLKCEFMMDKVGEVYPGTVSAVTSFGLFVQLDEVFVEGLVHITALPNDYYHFDPAGHRLQGERGGRVYRLGDRLQVRVMRVDLDSRKIDFELIEADSSGKGRKRRDR